MASPVRRGLENMRIQAFLTVAATNLKRLAAMILEILRSAIFPRPKAAHAAINGRQNRPPARAPAWRHANNDPRAKAAVFNSPGGPG